MEKGQYSLTMAVSRLLERRSMSELFPISKMAVEIICCPDRNKMSEFNVWYDKTCIPALRNIKGVVSVHRYVACDFDYGDITPDFFKVHMDRPKRFMTVYRINAQDPWSVCEEIKKVNDSLTNELINHLEFTLLDFYAVRKRVEPLLRAEKLLSDGMPEMILMIPNMDHVRDLEAVDDWWVYTHANDLMKIPGYVQASRYHNITPTFTEGDPLAVNFYEIASDDPIHQPLIEAMTGDVKRMALGRMLQLSSHPEPHFTYMVGPFEHWDIMSAI